MIRMSWKVVSTAATLTLVGGYAFGSAIAADGGTKQESVIGQPTVEVDALPNIGNGKTVGTLEDTVPVSERSDFIPVTLDDGRQGFVKRTDIDDELVWPEMTIGKVYKMDRKAFADAAAKQRIDLVQPNTKGEIWVNVYANDAQTIIGKKMMDDGADTTPPPVDLQPQNAE